MGAVDEGKTCPFCDDPIIPGERVLKEQAGYALPRKDGGVNALILRRDSGRVAHTYCVKLAKIHVPSNQEKML